MTSWAIGKVVLQLKNNRDYNRARSSSIETKITVDMVQALHEKNKHVSVRVRVVSL